MAAEAIKRGLCVTSMLYTAGLKKRQVTCAYDLNVMKNFKPDEYMRVVFLRSVAHATREKNMSSTEVE